MLSWIRLPMDLLKSELRKSSILVLAVLIDIDVETVEITCKRLSELTGLSLRAVKYATAELAEKGYIERIERTGRASRYYLKNVLPPKRRGRSITSEHLKSDFDLEPYKELINRF